MAEEKKVRKFEVVRIVNLGGGKVFEAGDTITSKQLEDADKAAKLEAGTTQQQLLAAGYVRDDDAPIPPSQAEGVAAFDRLARIAQKLGVLKRDGAEYRIGEKTAKGLTAFRSTVSIDELEAAIVKAASK